MRFLSLVLLLVLICSPSVSAWGFLGHSLISTAAAESLPDQIPAFVRSPSAVDEIGALGPEPDRSKGSGEPHDADLDTGHYLNLDDNDKVAGVVDLDALPASRRDYDTALRKAGENEYSLGYLPYSLMDGWEQVRMDFAIWRVDHVAETAAASADDRAYFAHDRALREILTLRDIGYWSHFVGDGSQPLHVTTHYNGWGKYPNPNVYTTEPIHSRFESAFVRAHATLTTVLAHMRPYVACNCTIQQEVSRYLRATHADVIPLYEIEKRGGFTNGSPEAVDFVNARLGDGATMLRDMIVEAWTQSATLKVGYPHGVTPEDAESGKAQLPRNLYGSD